MKELSQQEFEQAFSQLEPTPEAISQAQAVTTAENTAREHYYVLNDFANPYCHKTESIEYDAYEAMAHYLIQQKELEL